MLNFFKKTKATAVVEKKDDTTDWMTVCGTFNQKMKDSALESIAEPWTMAKERLNGGAQDIGAEKAKLMLKAHDKSIESQWQAPLRTKVSNQWVNPLQSVNTGYGTAQISFYNYQNVNYWECYALAQDPLFNKIFNILSKTPFSQGGEVSGDLSEEDRKALDSAIRKHNVVETIVKAVRSNYVCGGCLLYMDFGDEENLEDPLDLEKMDMRKFKGFVHIDPINVAALDVNSSEPAKADYMNPKKWYVVGLGNVHESRFLKFEDNVPELVMKPMALYFGFPLTLLIKQDIANSNLVSQGLANMINRFRNLYLQAETSDFSGAGAQNFRSRMEFMSLMQDNYMVVPIKNTENITQLTTSLQGLADNCEFFYQIVAAKTDITLSILLGKGAQGLSGTLEGERKNFYDRIRSIQEQVKPNLLKMLGIVFGAHTDGQFKVFEDYVFNPLEEPNEREKSENLRSYVEVARAMVDLGVSADKAIEWLKGFKEYRLDGVDIDLSTQGLMDYDNPADDFNLESADTQAFNAEFKESDHPRDNDGKFKKADSGDSSVKKDISEKNYKVFLTTDEIETFFGETGKLLERRQNPAQKWLQSLDAETKRYIGDYTSDGYSNINNFLRGRETAENENYDLNDAVEKIDRAISEFPLEENIVVYRAIVPEAFEGKDLKSMVGTEYTDKAYMSSSPTMKSTAVNKDVIFEISVPKGKGRGAWINGLSGFKGDEYEFLLKRGGKYIINDYEEKDGKQILKMEMITDD